MVMFCDKNENLKKNQYGFRLTRSCADVIASITEVMRCETDNEATGQACFIDPQKAFDTLHISVLLEKLGRYIYSEPVLAMIKS